MRQKGLKSGVLITWTKSFKCIDGVDQDAVVLLEEAIARHGVMNTFHPFFTFYCLLCGRIIAEVCKKFATC